MLPALDEADAEPPALAASAFIAACMLGEALRLPYCDSELSAFSVAAVELFALLLRLLGRADSFDWRDDEWPDGALAGEPE